MESLQLKQKITIMLSIMAVLLFSSLNMTIVGTALPKIISKLGGMEYFDWVFTIYMLTSSITAILVGKLSDIYGRKIFILSGIFIFSLGSLLSGFSGNIEQLILFRGIQGFGGGMLMSISFATVGDLFSPRERGRWQGILGATFGMASLFGPTLGGFIVDHFNWSWIFWVFLPFGVVAFLSILLLYPKSEKKIGESIDYLGSIVLSFFLVTLLLGFSWADSKYDWLSIQIISLFTASIVSLIAFILIEKKVKSPVVPLYLFKNSVFTISNIVSFFIGIGMFSVILYVPFYVQGVFGKSATISGLVEMAMTVAMVISSSIVGFLITKTGRYKIFAIVGLSFMTLGIFLNSTLKADSDLITIIMYLVITGIGLGMTFPIFNLTIQNAVSHKFLGVATATGQLFRELGGTIGVAIMGSVLGSFLMKKISKTEMPTMSAQENELVNIQDPQILMDSENLENIRNSIPEQAVGMFDSMVEVLKEALTYALNGVFAFSAAIILIAVITTFFLKEIPLRSTNEEEIENEEGTYVTENA